MSEIEDAVGGFRSRVAGERVTKPSVSTFKATEEHRDGETWLNQITGQEYKWSAARKVWVGTGRYPYGSNPMGFL